MKWHAIWILLVNLLLVGGCAGNGCGGCPVADDDDDDTAGDDDDCHATGCTVPNCQLTNQDGNTGAIHDSAGDVILLVISAGWCVPCAEAADEAQALSDELDAEFGFTLYETLIQDESFSEDVSQDTLQDWKDEHGLTYLDVWTDGTADCLDPFGAVELPTFVLIDRDLEIRDIITNYNPTIEQQIKDTLRSY